MFFRIYSHSRSVKTVSKILQSIIYLHTHTSM
jgi:hypothetical protein